ncbi:hypothetical protein WDW89_24735 [Deltaproteobacteria bacterium TL4]
MSNNSAEKSTRSISYVDYKEEIRIRMEQYPTQSDLLELFLKAYDQRKDDFQRSAEDLKLPLFDKNGKFKELHRLTFIEVEDITRNFGSCGYEFLESTAVEASRFYKYLPIRYQPYLDELFEVAFHRELETMQYCIDDFIKESKIDLEELNAVDLGAEPLTLSIAEKIAQGLYIPAFEMIKHEYILYVATKIKEYNPHRTFHRLHELGPEDQHTVLDYVRYIVQGDSIVTSGELQFIERLIEKFKTPDFDKEVFKAQLFMEVTLKDLRPLSSAVLDPIRRQILGLIIDSAYADHMLDYEEVPRILEIADLVMKK